jgi:hypothetical protein
MYLLLTDETNKMPSKDSKFFVYGGLIIPGQNLHLFNAQIEQIRLEAGYRPGDEFKFDTRSKPKGVSPENARLAKRQVINLCKELNCTFIAHTILHQIISRQKAAQHVEWAADYVIGRFNLFLQNKTEYGICLIDNLPEGRQFRYLTDKFQYGLSLPGEDAKRLDRVLIYGATAIGAGHVNSAMDIILGAFRYCINNPLNEDAAREILRSITPLMWHGVDGDQILWHGLILRPPLNEIKVVKYKLEYSNLIEKLNGFLGSS